MASIVLGKERNQPNAFKNSKLYKVINDEVADMIHGKEGNAAGHGADPSEPSKQTQIMLRHTDNKMKEMKKTEAEIEYYDKLNMLDQRVTHSHALVPLRPNDRSSLNSKDLLKNNNIFRGYDSTSIAQDTEKNLNKLIGSHSTENLAKIRSSRAMLNKHLEEKNKNLKDTEKDRKIHVDRFHSALRNTG